VDGYRRGAALLEQVGEGRDPETADGCRNLRFGDLRAISHVTPAAALPLAAMWKAMLARVGSAGPVLVEMRS